ncbi:GatB/YqeY domain-containing protein [Patescibacteria group bacterium]|nr:GatB/YqeY domain-containing protein [Patescibacteria group bacterium]
MNLQAQIDEKMKEAMRSQDVEALSLFRMLKSAIKNEEISKKAELEDADIIAVLEKQAKQRKDSIEQYEQGGRPDLADKEKSELKVIEEFLPEKMNEEEIRETVKAKIASMPDAQFGQVMGACMSELKGKADGQLVQNIVKEEMGS